MTMQRRHFKFIAETIAGMDPLPRAIAALAFARKLYATNPNFNRDRFLRACGVEG